MKTQWKMTAAALSALGALALAQPAAASVLYDFSFTVLGRGLADFSLHFETPDYITVTGLAPVASQPTSLSYDIQNFGENKSGWFLFSNTGGLLTDTIASLNPTAFAFVPTVNASDYDRAPGVYAGVVEGNAGPAGGFFGDATLTITDTSKPGAVPEPAAWALMIAGFALTGAALRRQRPATA